MSRDDDKRGKDGECPMDKMFHFPNFGELVNGGSIYELLESANDDLRINFDNYPSISLFLSCL